MKRRFINAISFAILTAFLCVGLVNGQSGTSGISGTISDQTGAVVPGASVKITNPATGFSRSTTTNDDGRFSFVSLPPATYKLEVEAKGFKKLVNNSVQALVDSPLDLNLGLETGDVSAVVDVTGGSIESITNTTDASVGNNFVPAQIAELPTDLRRITDLLTLQPGVTRDGYVAGGRSDQANITLDGVDINDQQTGGRSGGGDLAQGSALRSTTESVEEFRITTLGANANQGRSSGAQISLVTKSGTNDFRGSVFYFNRPTLGSANRFFNNRAGSKPDGTPVRPRPKLDRQVFGGAVGGPILKDRLFFFYSYEGQVQNDEISVNRLVPLPHLGGGTVRFSGTGPSCNASQSCSVGLAELNMIYNQAGMNPLAVAALASAVSKYPSNNIFQGQGDGINTGGFAFNSPTSVKENTHIAKFDWSPTSSQQISFRGNYQYDKIAGTSLFPDTPATSTWSHPYGYVASHNWTISNSKINNFRYGLTRQAFSTQGDSSGNNIFFRFVFSPLFYARTLNRVTPVHNFTDDFTWIKGNHTFQFGGNVRIIRNRRTTFASAFDSAVTNPSFYDLSGAVVNQPLTAAGYNITSGGTSARDAITALIGRYSQYSGNFTFDLDGSVLPAGTPSNRVFATEEYDSYIQDVWKLGRSLTLTLGLRYALSRPVYEANGLQVVPDRPLGDLFEARAASAARGVPLNTLINFVKGGPKNNGPGFYEMDKNNFQPRVAVAWSPHFDNKVGRFLFGGKEGDSVIRGGFGISNDYFGGQLAVSFDGLSTIGFTSSVTTSANTFNVTDRLAPLFTGYGQNIRTLPGIPAPTQRFSTPPDEQQRIETSLDQSIVSPKHYSWNVSYGRSLPKGMYFEASYLGRKARNLFGSRDVVALNNLVDPAGTDWYTAAKQLVAAQKAGVPYNTIAPIPYFEYFFPNAMAALNVFGIGATSNTRAIYALFADDGFGIRDYTFIQLIIDDATEFGLPMNPGRFPNMFYHPQYGAFSAFGTFANSDYHGATFSLRQRLGSTLTYDFNYTFSKSLDDVSGLQTDGSYGGQFLLNPLRQRDSYALSDFDVKHSINANFIFDLPVGKGKKFLGGVGSLADALVGGWSLRGIFRLNSGQPLSVPGDAAQWATNWNVTSGGTRVRPVVGRANRDTASFFGDAQTAYNSFRNALPGETGERNVFRLPGYSVTDMGLSKTFQMPWNENHKFQFRWEVFNVFNQQYFLANSFTTTSYALGADSDTCRPTSTPSCSAPSNFGQIFADTQGNPRRQQFGLKFIF